MAPKRLAVQVQFVRFVRFNFNCPKYSEVLLSYLQMIYTCYEMVRDCRADLPQGWAYFVSEYDPMETGPMVKMEPKTVEKIRNRAAELIRAKAGNWNRALLAENGAALGRQAAEGGKDCLPVKAFLDLIDGRATWRRREEIETHVNRCWHCVDHFCRMLEIVEQLRGLQPLSDAASE